MRFGRAVLSGGIVALIVWQLGYAVEYSATWPLGFAYAAGGIAVVVAALAVMTRLHRLLLALALLVSLQTIALAGGIFTDWIAKWIEEVPDIVEGVRVSPDWETYVSGGPPPTPLRWTTTIVAGLCRLVGYALCIVLGLEFAALAFFMAFAGKERFFSARGWRPSIRRPLSSVARIFGFPSYLTQLRRGGFLPTVLYVVIACINSTAVILLVLPLALPVPEIRDALSPNPSAQTFETGELIFIGFAIAMAALAIVGGPALVRLAHRASASRYQSVRDWDDRPPVVFLRSFQQDQAKIDFRPLNPLLRMPAGLARAQNIDEILLDSAAPIGPVIAIGEPGNAIPPLGAARVFVRHSDSSWQEVVADLIDASRVVVLCPGQSEGVAWELAHVSSEKVLPRVIFLASPAATTDEVIQTFAKIIPSFPQMTSKQVPIAAFRSGDQWIVLTAGARTLQSYTVALNRALQDLVPSATDDWV
jgi:hypothetical protein